MNGSPFDNKDNRGRHVVWHEGQILMDEWKQSINNRKLASDCIEVSTCVTSHMKIC